MTTSTGKFGISVSKAQPAIKYRGIVSTCPFSIRQVSSLWGQSNIVTVQHLWHAQRFFPLNQGFARGDLRPLLRRARFGYNASKRCLRNSIPARGGRMEI